MDEQNNDINRLDTVLGVKEDKSAGSKIKNFIKKLGNVPEQQEVKITTRADFRKTNREFNKQLKVWERASKRHSGVPLINYFIGDKHKVNATKRLFADMEKTARKSVQKYTGILNNTLGENRNKQKNSIFDLGGELGDVKQAHDANIKSRDSKRRELKTLKDEREELSAKNSLIGLTNKESTVMTDMNKAMETIKSLETQKNTLLENSFDSVQAMKMIDTNATKIKNDNKTLSKLAAGFYNKTGNDKLFKTLEKQLDASIKVDEDSVNNIATKIREINGKKGSLVKKLNALKKEPVSDERTAAINNIQKDISNADADIKGLKRDMRIAERYLKLSKGQKEQFMVHYDNRVIPNSFGKSKKYTAEDLENRFDSTMNAKNTHTQNMVDNINKLTAPKELTDINKKLEEAYNKSYNLKIELQEISSQKNNIKVNITDEDTVEDITKELKAKDERIKQINKSLKQEQDEGKKLMTIFRKLRGEIKNANTQLTLLKRDMNIDPIKIEVESDDLKKYNDIVDDINNGVNRIGKNWRKSNVITRLASRILLNIRSQIADMINPLTLFRRGWDQWINRFDNLPWKNTFDVIGYNLVTALTPVFEWFAKVLIKGAQILNVFIKRWTGVDLFDKSAWQLEQMKKGVGQLTAGFDELHATTDNPNQFNTIFDTMDVEPLSPKLTEELTKWADRIANAFKWIKEHWLELVALWAGFKLAGGLLHLLSWGKSLKDVFTGLSLIKFGDFTFGLLGVLGVVKLIKEAWDSIEWSKNWGGMLPEERIEEGDKNIKGAQTGGKLAGSALGWFTGKAGHIVGGATGLAGGLSGAIIGMMFGDGIAQAIYGAFHTAVSGWKGVTEETEHFAGEMGEGIGKVAGTYVGGKIGILAAAKLGAMIGTTFGPVGTAIGTVIGAGVGFVVGGKLGEVLGTGFGKLVNGIQDITRGKGDFQKLKISLNDVEKATEMVTNKTAIYNQELGILRALEEQVGITGEELFLSVQSGSASYDQLTYSQKSVYDQYVKMAEAQKDLSEAQQQQLEYSAKYQEQLGRESGSFTEYINTLQKGVDDGIISQEKMVDYFAQTYGKIDADAKKVFLEQLPSHLRESVTLQGAEYETLGNKIATAWDNTKTAISNKIQEIKQSLADGWEEMKTNAVTAWENFKTSAGTAWENIKTTVGNTWENMKTLGSNIWTSICIEANESWQELKTTASTVWENIKTTASTAWENIKNSAIGQKVQEIVEDAKVGWENLKTKAGETWENVKTTASTIWDNIKNSAIGQKVQEIVENTKTGWENLKTSTAEAWENLKTNTVEAWENIKTGLSDTWENLKTKASETWENIKTKVGDTWENMKTKAGETWENIKTKASETWENIKESAIGQKVQEIWKNTTEKFAEIKTKVSEGWNTLKTNAKEKWNSIKDSIVTAAKTAWDNAKGFFDKIGEGVKKAWEGIKGLASRTGERIGNFFDGKGFKTDQEYDEYVKKYGVPQYAVGTNYVPNDQLAMIHKGEAIIPAKYNKPYTPPANNGELDSTISAMTQEIANLRSLIQSGITVKGEFKQRGSDLVAVVEKGRYRNGNSTLSNPAYAR